MYDYTWSRPHGNHDLVDTVVSRRAREIDQQPQHACAVDTLAQLRGGVIEEPHGLEPELRVAMHFPQD